MIAKTNLEINLGKGCDNRCLFCATGRESRDDPGWMSVKAVGEALASGRARGATAVGFLGGEPTRYPELTRVIGLAREAGFARIAICTNGRRLGKGERLEELLEAGLTRVALSIHSHRRELEDEINQRPGAFDQKLQAISHLTRAREAGRLPDGFALNTVLHAKNVAQLDSLVAFFKGRGVDDLRLNFIRPENQAEGNPGWVPSFARTTPRLLALVVRNETDFGLALGFADIPWCRYPWEVLSSAVLRGRYLGEMRDLDTDVTLYRSDDRGGPRRFHWQAQRVGQLKCHLAVCERCSLRTRCEGVWRGYVDIHGDGEFSDGPTVARACDGGGR